MDKIDYMKSLNFENLRSFAPTLADLGAHAEKYVYEDPQSALIKLRCFAESLVGIVFNEWQLPRQPNESFIDRLNNDAFIAIVDTGIIDKLHAIRKVGNRAAHEGKFGQGDAQWLLKEAHILGCWLMLSLKKGQKSDLVPFYDLPKTHSETNTDKKSERQLSEYKARLKQAITELEQAQEAELEAQRQSAQLQQALDHAQRVSLANQSHAAVNQLDLNEAQTRQRLIDAEIHSRGWNIDLIKGQNTEEVSREDVVDGQPTSTGIGYVDYVLWGADGKPIAVIEAKRTRESAKKGQKQAELYADALERKYGQRPVIFYTNGHEYYLLDDAQGYIPRKLYGMYSKDSVQYLIRQRTSRQPLSGVPIDTAIAGRNYQIEAITRICENYELKRRKALVVQATGTGKTRVSIALSKRMLEAGWAKRILFLCDRKELRKQAAKAYNEFISESLYVVGRSKKSDKHNARIYISTYPGMMGIMEEFDPGYFDLIIADESHRSIYNVYGDLFKYFDAMQLGLTATPVEMISRSTSKLFGCDYKLATANYPLDQAVEDGNLVPFKVVTHTTQFLREGIVGKSLTDEQIAELEDQGIDPNTLDFDAKSVDKAVFNKDTNRLILRNLMEHGLKMADGQTLGKTIVFARNIQHAELLTELFGELYPEMGGNFCRVIHSKYERAEALIDDFKAVEGRDSQITVAISVDMLDTGIDVPEVLNLVFAKPIKSKVKFWQMVGRGTRLCLDLFGLGQHKSKFLIFDHWGNFDYFEMDPDEDDSKPIKSLSEKLFEARVNFADAALKKGEIDQFEKMIVLIKQDIDALNDNSIAVKDNWQLKQNLSRIQLLNQFAPETKTQLLDNMAPLMQWRNIVGQSEALKLDLDILVTQAAVLVKNAPAIASSKIALQEKVRNLSMNLSQVRRQSDEVKKIQDDHFWDNANFDGLEQSRVNLRPIIHLQKKGYPPLKPNTVIDVTEIVGEVKYGERKTKIDSVDYEIYRQEVEKTLTPLFQTDPVLQKIRAGQPITANELSALNALVHTQNPSVDLYLLKEFYPDSTVGVDQLLRTIVGMDSAQVNQQFNQFIQQHHVNLTAIQQRFLNLLQQEICRKGQMTVAALYDQPFKSLHEDGIDGLFQNEQASLIATFVAGFTVVTERPALFVETDIN